MLFIVSLFKTGDILAGPSSSSCSYSGQIVKYYDGKCYYCYTSGVPPVSTSCPLPTSTPAKTPTPTTIKITPPSQSQPSSTWCTYSGKKDKYSDGKCYYCYSQGVPPIPASCPLPTSTPAKTPTSSFNSCEYINFTECRNDCSGSCVKCGIGNKYNCVVKVLIPTKIPTPTKSADDLFNKDCRCINGVWSGGSCDGWQRGKSCLPASSAQCKTNSQQCTGASDTSCCSGYCVPSYYGYYCQSAAEVAKGCTSLTTKCDGNYLMKCINGSWVKDKLCNSCQQSSSGGNCLELKLTPTKTSTLSPQDEYRLRRDATIKYITNEDNKPIDKLAAYLITMADTASYGWSYTSALTAPVKIILGTVTNNLIGDKDAGIEVGSKFYEYEKAQMEANAVAASEGVERKPNVWAAVVSGSVGGIEQVDGLFMNLPSKLINSATDGGWDNVTNTALSNALGNVDYEIEAAKATIEAGKEAGDIAAIVYAGFTQLNKGLNNAAGSIAEAPVSMIEGVIAKYRPPGKVAGTAYDLIMPSKNLSGKTLEDFIVDQVEKNTVGAAQEQGLLGIVDGALYSMFDMPYQWFK